MILRSISPVQFSEAKILLAALHLSNGRSEQNLQRALFALAKVRSPAKEIAVFATVTGTPDWQKLLFKWRVREDNGHATYQFTVETNWDEAAARLAHLCAGIYGAYFMLSNNENPEDEGRPAAQFACQLSARLPAPANWIDNPRVCVAI